MIRTDETQIPVKYRHPYRRTQNRTLDLTGLLAELFEQIGTPAMPLPDGISPAHVGMLRHLAAAMHSALRPVNAAIEAALPRPA